MPRGSEHKCSESDFVRLFEELGATKLSTRLGISVRRVHARREALERRLGRQITGPEYHNNRTRHGVAHPQRVQIKIRSGRVLVGSDAHIWPGPKSTAMRGFIKFCKIEQPDIVILNGDVLDFPQVSRHPPIGWERHPSVHQEIEAAQAILSEIERAAFNARKVWTLGNHDGRFETRLATVAPEFAKINGIHLRDHFPLWEPGWSCWINDVVIKHRFKGGAHATHNNAVASGRHMVTGHLHSSKVAPWTDYNGTRYGVDTGCLADPDHRAFVDYTEDNPKNWRSGFALLTFHEGRLLMPELVQVFDENHVEFRGKVIPV